jgi:hypothetical protein
MSRDDGGIIDDGVVVVTNNRIAAVGRKGQVRSRPARDRRRRRQDHHPRPDRRSTRTAPTGLTSWCRNRTGRCRSTWRWDHHHPRPVQPRRGGLRRAELQQAGKIIGPHIFSTGEIVYGAKAARNYAQIDSLTTRSPTCGGSRPRAATRSRTTTSPAATSASRWSRRPAARTCRSVAEGAALFGQDMTIIADGNSTLEHNIPQLHLYEDVLSFMSQSGTNYTPDPGRHLLRPAGDPYWRSHTNVFEQPS